MSTFVALALLLSLHASAKDLAFVEEWSLAGPRFSEHSVFQYFLGGDGNLYLYEVQRAHGLLTGPGRLTAISPQGRILRTVESPFFSSLAIAVDRQSRIYLWGMEDARSLIRIFSPEGEQIRTLETPTLQADLLLVDAAGFIYAVGLHVHNGREARFEHLDGTIVHVFAPDGREVAAFGSWEDSLPLNRRVQAASRSLLAFGRDRLLLYPNRPMPPDRFLSPLQVFAVDRGVPRLHATFDLGRLSSAMIGSRVEAQRPFLSEDDVVEGVAAFNDRVVLNVMRKAPTGRFQSVILLISPEGRFLEVPVPAPGLGRLIGVDSHGHFYFEYRHPSWSVVKARLIER
jgi:hypothetical protein